MPRNERFGDVGSALGSCCLVGEMKLLFMIYILLFVRLRRIGVMVSVYRWFIMKTIFFCKGKRRLKGIGEDIFDA